MSSCDLNRYILRQILSVQREEITMGEIYAQIASKIGDQHSRDVLRGIAGEELENYRFWKKYTDSDTSPDSFQILISSLILRVLGYTFTLKLLASWHARCINRAVIDAIPDAESVLCKDLAHKKQIIELTDRLDEERFRYVGAIVLGLNDALVEFVGTLAGLTFALQNNKLIAITGIVAGISASLSMAASEYLSLKSGKGSEVKPLKAAMYTGLSYVTTVALLLLPFIVLNSPYIALLFTLATALLIIIAFTFYLSVAKSLDFKTRLAEMAVLSLGIAVLSFIIGLGARLILHVTV